MGLSRDILLRLASVCVLLPLCACIYDYPDPDCKEEAATTLVVDYDWNDAAQYTPNGYYRTPDGMAILLYPPSANDYWRYDIPAKGASINPPPDSYTAISFNNDTGNILFFNDDSLSSFYISTREGKPADGFSSETALAQPPRPRAAALEKVLTQPEMFWAAVIHDVCISADRNYPDTLMATPLPVVACYTVTVDDIENLSSASAFSMSISGLAAGFNFYTFSRLDEKVIVPGALEKKTARSVGGSLLSFGMPENLPHTATLSLYFWLRDGRKVMFEYPVSDIIASSPNPLDVQIGVHSLQLPAIAGGSGSGMEVDVDNWDIIDIELST